MNILFLDIDGVLNSKQHVLLVKEIEEKNGKPFEIGLEYMKQNINPNNIWCLKYLLEKVPTLKIVLSTSWRNHFEIEQFKELFKHYGLDGERIIGKTPRKLSSERRHEIRMWLDDTPETTNDENTKWLALDDHAIWDLMHEFKQFEILTDGWVGLTMNEVFKIIKYFDPKFKEPEILI